MATTDLLERARTHSWYHVMELAPGEVTDGWFDLRPSIHHYGIPERLDGLRVLEIGTWDGFWAFELERRGAAEVVALDLDDEADLDWPPRRRPREFSDVRRGDGFRLAKAIRGSNVERVNCSVYHATPEELGDVRPRLLRLGARAPARPAARARADGDLCTGQLILAEEYDKRASLVPFRVSRYLADRDKAVVFWLPSKRRGAGWSGPPASTASSSRARSTMKVKDEFTVPHVVIHGFKV